MCFGLALFDTSPEFLENERNIASHPLMSVHKMCSLDRAFKRFRFEFNKTFQTVKFEVSTIPRDPS